MDDKTIAYSYSGDPTNALQKALEIEAEVTNKDKMKMNASKCHAITFNFCPKKRATPQSYVKWQCY